MIMVLFIALGVAVLTTLFALQNTAPITVAFFRWKFDSSLALVLLLALAAGILVGLSVALPALVRRSWRISTQRKKIDELESSLTEKNEPKP